MSGRARRIWSVLAGLVVLGLVVILAILLWPVPRAEAVAAPAASPQLVARGAYIATAADCVACHTVEGGQPYAGGRAFRLPFGTLYAPNITPDRETGIGAWTDGEFVRAVRHGVGREGEQLYPAFPYTSYARMPEDEILAVKAYLFSLPPVRSEVRENGLAFPFNQRPLMRFWKILFLRGGAFEPAPQQTAEWNRGAYLVNVLGHCGECHTPRNLAFGYFRNTLSGETMQGWTAWNITSDPRHGIGAWSADELVSYFRTGYAPGRAVASGPMKEAVDFSLAKLTDGDLRAMAVYLKSKPASDQGPVPNQGAGRLARASLMAPPPGEEASEGRRIFEGACASCHAWNGAGQQTPLAALAGRRAVAAPDGANVVQTILRGGSINAPQGHAFMPAFARAYSDAEIAAVANYVVEHFGGVDGEVGPRDVARARRD
ncbi:cytochrome c [Phenylobacterium sp.]|uniref:cytochrome c n=1 Tax=Phenylobacterium sp. TaxID=1871053 RepID=UPI0035ADC103